MNKYRAIRTISRLCVSNKYNARRTFSILCNRTFSSQSEAKRGEELRLLEMAGLIKDLEYQVRFVLSQKPRISITVDFAYTEDGVRKYEDVKGMGETREFRVKRIWLKEKYGVDIELVR